MRRKAGIALALGTLCVGWWAVAYSQHPGATLTAAMMREDLVFLRDTWGPMDRSFSTEARHSFVSALDDAIASAADLTEADFALTVTHAVAMAGNAHTRAEPFDFLSFMPVRLWWFSDGLYVVRAHPDHSDLIGAEVQRIGNLTAEEALEQMTPLLSGTAEWGRFLSPSYLISLEALHWAGIARSRETADLTLRLRSGETRHVSLGRQPRGGPPVGGLSLLRPPALNNPDRWPHVLDRIDDVPPSLAPSTDVSHEWLRDDVVYIRSNQVASSDQRSLHAKFVETLHEIERRGQPAFAVVDLRFNTGGDLYNTIVFSQMLPALVPDEGRIYVLVGNVTLSAALTTAALLRVTGGDKVILAGETMGDRPRFWAEGRPIALPNSGMPVAPAGGLHDWGDGCGGEEHCFLAAQVYAQAGVSLDPDVRLAMSFEQYAEGRDDVLEAVIGLMP
jgi:hypothetical protein